jgi:hypothetical protein
LGLPLSVLRLWSVDFKFLVDKWQASYPLGEENLSPWQHRKLYTPLPLPWAAIASQTRLSQRGICTHPFSISFFN